MRRIGSIALLLLALAACGSSSGSSAQAVVDDFSAAGLAVPAPRDNSRNCDTLGCTALVTTDAISVYTFDDSAAAQKMAASLGEGGHLDGGVLLSYAAARTPEGQRPAYEARLREFLAKQ